ncbi:MAG: DUF4304 domain-containing protein [Leptolyngbya sp. SIO3F4]|nr:DUF4304 domain-containing protein [Leptolyngbya sp. SIO3F4]
MKKEVFTHLDPIMKGLGYHKKRNTWHKKHEIGVASCEYQKSRFFDGFYLNFGVTYSHFFDSEGFPNSDNWHFESRYDRILAKSSLMNFHIQEVNLSEVNNDNFWNELKNNLEHHVIPELEKLLMPSYMKDNFPNNFDHDTWWLTNVTEPELIRLLHES